MASQTVAWGNISLLMDHPAFQEGYKDGRRYYFTDDIETGGKDESSGVLTASSLLRVIAIPDQAGHYQLDNGCDFTTLPDGVEELLGVLAGTSLWDWLSLRSPASRNTRRATRARSRSHRP